MPRVSRKNSTPVDREEPKTAYRRQAEKLMTVALELFATRGFSSITIKDIAKAAKINSALLYYYFTSKEDLFKSSIELAILDALENYARLREKHTNPVDLINDWFENNVQMASPLRKLVKVMLDYSNSQAELASIDALIKRFYKEEMSILSSSIEEGMAMGLFDAVDAARAAEFASVHLDGIMTASMIRADLRLDDAVAELKTTFWQRLGYREKAAPAKRAAGRR
jgi:AcrR family transcriptional regulator